MAPGEDAELLRAILEEMKSLRSDLRSGAQNLRKSEPIEMRKSTEKRSRGGDLEGGSSKSQTGLEGEEPKLKPLYSNGFLLFWTAYPKRKDKGRAWRYWKREKLDGHLAQILRAIAEQEKSDQWRREGGRFIKNPATWLNDRSWEDEPMKVSDNGKPKLTADVPPGHPAHGMTAGQYWAKDGKQYRLGPRWEMFIESGPDKWDYEETVKGAER